MPKGLVIVPFPLDDEGVANRKLQLKSVKLGPDIDFDFRPVRASCTSFSGSLRAADSAVSYLCRHLSICRT